jgi:hypothetical protein
VKEVRRMPFPQQRTTTQVAARVLCVALVVLLPSGALAQGDDSGSAVGTIVRRVLLDPTTYAPAAIAYDATMRDWNSSQPFFRNGYFEHNPRFTISGLPNDRPVSYAEGRQRILKDALVHLELAALHNTFENIVEHTLVSRFPEHRKLFRVLGWIERGAYASYASYVLSSQHYRQWRANERLAAEVGLR